MQQLHARFIEFSARTRMSGIDMDGGMEIRKGAADAIRRYVEAGGNTYPKECEEAVQSIAEQGGHRWLSLKTIGCSVLSI